MQLQPGVVHGWQDASGAISALAALLCGVPHIVIGTRSVAPLRKEGRNRPWLNDLMRGLLADPRVRLVNNSRSGALDYERWLALRPGDVSLVPNGFDLPEKGDAPDSEPGSDRVRIGGVMRLTEEKRPDLWLDVIIELLDRGCPVEGLLVGDGPMMARISGRVAEPPHLDWITLAGRQEDMVSQYAGMDLLLLTSRTEGLPNMLVEAQALGVPVVSTDAGGASETFLDGRSGLLIRSGTAANLADALERLIGDSGLRDAFAAAGIEHARTEFSLARMIERTAKLYGWQEIRND